MKVSYNWLQTFFAEPLPVTAELAELLTFHSSEIEEVVPTDGDTMIDVKVLPDKSAWLLSHRGVAKEIGTILGRSIKNDPLTVTLPHNTVSDSITLTIDTPLCDRYEAALMTGVTVGPSPDWLQARLKVIGQRPINNVVDVANYVMFEMGQPLHAFDAAKLELVSERYSIGVRQAKVGETITTLMGESVTLTVDDMVVVDGMNDTPVAIAGVKGGSKAAVDETTTTLLIEAAHFDRVAVRKTAQRHNLRTDASARYENGVPRALTSCGLRRVCELLSEITGGSLVTVAGVGKEQEERVAVTVSLAKINSVLGLQLAAADVTQIIERLHYHYTLEGEVLTVTPPFERDDLIIPEDVIEEIGRFYGMTHIAAIAPVGTLPTEINVRHVYAERIRTALCALGFSEVMTSSFRNQDQVKIKNALATDKGYLRSNLAGNLTEALVKNIPHRDLLGVSAILIFELGTVFAAEGEYYHLGLAVRSNNEYKAKVDDVLLQAAIEAVGAALGQAVPWLTSVQGMAECRLSDILPLLPVPHNYDATPLPLSTRYQSFSLYPAVSRDIALWVTEGSDVEEMAAALHAAAGTLCVRLTHIDTFTKDGRTSLAFRLVFQAPDRTLIGEEIDIVMSQVAAAVVTQGGEVR